MDAWDSPSGRFRDPDSSSGSYRPEKCGRRCCLSCLKSNVFLMFMAVGIGAGVGIGLGIRNNYPDFGKDPRNVMYLAFPGDLLLRMLKMCIIPLVVTSLIYGMASLPSKAAGKLGGYAVLYYMITTFMAVLLGILLVYTIQPGTRGVDRDLKQDKAKLVEPVDALLDLVRNLFPDNLIGACTQRTRTTYDEKEVKELMYNETGDYNYTETRTVIEAFHIRKDSGTNVLGLVMFSILIGVILGRMGPRGEPLLQTIDGLQEGIISIVKLIIWYTPVGITFLLASRIVAMEDPEREFAGLGWYIMTVLVGLGIHGFVVLPIIYIIFVRANPYKLMMHSGEALFTALATASSSATMPVTLECLEEKAKIDRRITRFVIPVGATINMDGTALYEAVASIFIAQTLGYELDAGQYATVSITATAAAIGAAGVPEAGLVTMMIAAIGAAGVPEAGLVTMMIVLIALGLPIEEIGLIYAVDWFLDRVRTAVNVWGDSVGAGIVAKLSRGQLHKLDDQTFGMGNPAFISNGKLTPGANSEL